MSGEGRGLGDFQKRQRKSVEIRGTRYESLAAAAKALGVSEQTVRRAAKRGTENRVGLRKERADGN
jgi:transposase